MVRKIEKIKELGTFGNISSIAVGTSTLITNTYNSMNGDLKKATYGNGQEISYAYDRFGRLSEQSNTDGAITYEYDEFGNLKTIDNTATGEEKTITYDTAERIEKQTTTIGQNEQEIEYTYDIADNIDTAKYSLNNTENVVEYVYDKDDRITSIKPIAGTEIITNYDQLSRTTSKQLEIGTETYETEYGYIKLGQVPNKRSNHHTTRKHSKWK